MPLENGRVFEKAPDVKQSELLLQKIVAVTPCNPSRQMKQPLYLYGAGMLGRMAWDYFKKVGVDVKGVIDKAADQQRSDPFWQGAPLFAPEEISEEIKQNALLAMCIVTLPWGEVTEPLYANGWKQIVPFYSLCHDFADQHPLDNGWLSGVLTQDDQREMMTVLARYGDDVSRAHHLQFTAWHTLLQEWVFKDAPIDVSNRYFIPEIVAKLHDHEAYLDLGAHHGSVVFDFLKQVRETFFAIMAVEADPDNRSALEQALAALDHSVCAKIAVAPVVVGRAAGHGRFVSGLGYVSRLVSSGGDAAEVQTLDNLDFSPTFIKAHLEGGELAALLGGRTMIRRCRPIIALTVYHNRQGLWLIAKTLMETMERYRFLFRLHGWQGTGGVLYLIPEER